jgi:hypothetical protein
MWYQCREGIQTTSRRCGISPVMTASSAPAHLEQYINGLSRVQSDDG